MGLFGLGFGWAVDIGRRRAEAFGRQLSPNHKPKFWSSSFQCEDLSDKTKQIEFKDLPFGCASVRDSYKGLVLQNGSMRFVKKQIGLNNWHNK